MDNPYEHSLRGLELKDPVQAFFGWCREREKIREKRERGIAPPWSDDPIFQRGRFLNVFREDDRGSKAVGRFVGQARKSTAAMIRALFFARWCNLAATLDRMNPGQLDSPETLRRFLLEEAGRPWWSDAYPVVDALWEGKSYNRLEACVGLFLQAGDFLESSIRAAAGDVVAATRAINRRFGMTNTFPIFMAVIDISWFDAALIRPDSPVPTGIGSAPYMDLLQRHLGLSDHHATMEKMMDIQSEHWPEGRRRFTPVDIEYICCECRKYYSYVTGTKQFEGKNLFAPESANHRIPPPHFD